MSINLNDNLFVNAGKPIDGKYLSGTTGYSSIAAVNAAISVPLRYVGLTVNIANIEYWYKNGVEDGDLEEKKYDSELPVGEYVSGATNLGLFTGFTGIQKLTIAASGTAEDGDYFSEYQYYHVDSSGIIRISNENYQPVLRRGYVRTSEPIIKSWIYSYYSGGSYQIGWQVVTGDIRTSVSSSLAVVPYTGTQYTEEYWSVTGGSGSGYYNNGGDLTVDVSGDLTTGSTLIIGAGVYAKKDDGILGLRTIRSLSTDVLTVTQNDDFISFSGATALLNGENLGTANPVFKQKTGTTLQTGISKNNY